MHTPLCRHATGEPVAYAARAKALGLAEIGFSDHSPMPQDDFDDWRMRMSQLDEYVAKVHHAKQEHPDLVIKLALEVDYLPGQEPWIHQLWARHPWDYFIGSVHYISGGWDVDNPNRLAEWKKRDTFAVWHEYYERLTQAVESGLFHIIGHCDLPKKFGFRPAADCTTLFETFLNAAARQNVAIELNTAGLRKECREIYPSRKILEMAFAHGVVITFGSDAHLPEEVGANFAEAMALAKSVGYREWRRFTAGRAAMVPLDAAG